MSYLQHPLVVEEGPWMAVVLTIFRLGSSLSYQGIPSESHLLYFFVLQRLAPGLKTIDGPSFVRSSE